MPLRKRVQDAHMSERIRSLHGALLSIVSVMNRPQRDELLIREAGIPLDRALFPLLVGIERLGPIGIVDLADRVGRDYTTVSRQVTKLEGLGLVRRQTGGDDRRVREAAVTPKGKVMTDAVDAARDRLGRALFAKWNERDIEELVRLLQKFAEDIEAEAPSNRAGAS
jgi:DNA-binding MarR family transcriptional regulator